MDKITNILVTGPSGNVGREVVKNLLKTKESVFAADLHKEAIAILFGDSVKFRKLDFYDRKTLAPCLNKIDRIFLMRPPEIGNVQRYMFPFINLIKKKGVEHVVTLSIADANPMVPHYKVEKYLEELEIPYTHLRVGYFMQNLSTTHKESIQKEKDIYIPAGDAKFNFTDVRDIGEVAAKLLLTGEYKNQTIHITGKELFDFHEIAKKMRLMLKQPIKYSNPSGRAFKKKMLDYGFDKDMIRVMRMIYFAARKKKSDTIYDDFEKIMGKKPITIEKYLKDYSESWI